jgi:hypothetical protein
MYLFTWETPDYAQKRRRSLSPPPSRYSTSEYSEMELTPSFFSSYRSFYTHGGISGESAGN